MTIVDGRYVNAVRELPEAAPFWEPVVTLVLVMRDGTLAQSHLTGGKPELLTHVGEAAHVLAAWHGEWRTDVFTVSRERCVAEVKARRARPRMSGDDLDRALAALTAMK